VAGVEKLMEAIVEKVVNETVNAGEIQEAVGNAPEAGL
jgi:hypothetical protein